MSTYLYLECLDHFPPLRAEDESGQHLSDLPAIREIILNRDALIYVWEKNWLSLDLDYFAKNSIRFLRSHQNCNIGIISEYGEAYPLEPESDIDHTSGA